MNSARRPGAHAAMPTAPGAAPEPQTMVTMYAGPCREASQTRDDDVTPSGSPPFVLIRSRSKARSFRATKEASMRQDQFLAIHRGERKRPHQARVSLTGPAPQSGTPAVSSISVQVSIRGCSRFFTSTSAAEFAASRAADLSRLGETIWEGV